MTRRTPADALLHTLRDHNVGLALSDPISARLDGLVDLVERAAERTNRKELVAALILATEPNGDELAAVVRRYRVAIARDAVLAADPTASVLVFPGRRPGPRPRR